MAAVASIDAAQSSPSKRSRDGDSGASGLRLQRPPQAPSHRGCGVFVPNACHLEEEPPPSKEVVGSDYAQAVATMAAAVEEASASALAGMDAHRSGSDDDWSRDEIFRPQLNIRPLF